MKLGLKIPLAFAWALLFLFFSALFGIYSLNQPIATYETVVAANFDHAIKVTNIALHFKTQVQEWKDVLLRGSKP